LFFEISVLRR